MPPTHYYQFIAGLKREFERGQGQHFDTHGDRSWRFWFRQPYNPLAFDLVEQSKPKDFVGSTLNLDVSGKLKNLGRLPLWAYDLDDHDDNALLDACRQAAMLCVCAEHALLAQAQKPEVQKVVMSYFGGSSDPAQYLISHLVPHYVDVMTHLGKGAVVLAKGDPAKKRGRDALAYVDTFEDRRALDRSGLADTFQDRVIIIYINDLSAAGVSGQSPTQQADGSMKPGASLLHELTHLCGDKKAEDHDIRHIAPDVRSKLQIPGHLREVYGRTACRALGAHPVYCMLNLTNADTLALLAVDLYLVQVRGMEVEEVLELK